MITSIDVRTPGRGIPESIASLRLAATCSGHIFWAVEPWGAIAQPLSGEVLRDAVTGRNPSRSFSVRSVMEAAGCARVEMSESADIPLGNLCPDRQYTFHATCIALGAPPGRLQLTSSDFELRHCDLEISSIRFEGHRIFDFPHSNADAEDPATPPDTLALPLCEAHELTFSISANVPGRVTYALFEGDVSHRLQFVTNLCSVILPESASNGSAEEEAVLLQRSLIVGGVGPIGEGAASAAAAPPPPGGGGASGAPPGPGLVPPCGSRGVSPLGGKGGVAKRRNRLQPMQGGWKNQRKEEEGQQQQQQHRFKIVSTVRPVEPFRPYTLCIQQRFHPLGEDPPGENRPASASQQGTPSETNSPPKLHCLVFDRGGHPEVSGILFSPAALPQQQQQHHTPGKAAGAEPDMSPPLSRSHGYQPRERIERADDDPSTHSTPRAAQRRVFSVRGVLSKPGVLLYGVIRCASPLPWSLSGATFARTHARNTSMQGTGGDIISLGKVSITPKSGSTAPPNATSGNASGNPTEHGGSWVIPDLEVPWGCAVVFSAVTVSGGSDPRGKLHRYVPGEHEAYRPTILGVSARPSASNGREVSVSLELINGRAGHSTEVAVHCALIPLAASLASSSARLAENEILTASQRYANAVSISTTSTSSGPTTLVARVSPGVSYTIYAFINLCGHSAFSPDNIDEAVTHPSLGRVSVPESDFDDLNLSGIKARQKLGVLPGRHRGVVDTWRGARPRFRHRAAAPPCPMQAMARQQVQGVARVPGPLLEWASPCPREVVPDLSVSREGWDPARSEAEAGLALPRRVLSPGHALELKRLFRAKVTMSIPNGAPLLRCPECVPKNLNSARDSSVRVIQIRKDLSSVKQFYPVYASGIDCTNRYRTAARLPTLHRIPVGKLHHWLDLLHIGEDSVRTSPWCVGWPSFLLLSCLDEADRPLLRGIYHLTAQAFARPAAEGVRDEGAAGSGGFNSTWGSGLVDVKCAEGPFDSAALSALLAELREAAVSFYADRRVQALAGSRGGGDASRVATSHSAGLGPCDFYRAVECSFVEVATTVLFNTCDAVVLLRARARGSLLSCNHRFHHTCNTTWGSRPRSAPLAQSPLGPGSPSSPLGYTEFACTFSDEDDDDGVGSVGGGGGGVERSPRSSSPKNRRHTEEQSVLHAYHYSLRGCFAASSVRAQNVIMCR